jgi:hypothetical protein
VVELEPVAVAVGLDAGRGDVEARAAALALPVGALRVWRFELDEGARPVETTLTRAVVRSRAQWSYDDAQCGPRGC